MANRLPEHQRKAIVRIRTRQEQESWGTGFFVAPDMLLTAFHVIADRSARPEEQPALYPGPATIELHGGSVVDGFELVDGAWDADADWALLRVRTDAGVTPLTLSGVAPDDVDWTTWGFPRDQYVDGLVLGGTIENVSGELHGTPAIQLWCKHLAAGSGGRAAGASGAPVIVGDRVIGLLRFSLSDEEGRSRAGTLYACPATALHGRADLTFAAPPSAGSPLSPDELGRVGAACGRVAVPGGGWSTAYLVAPGWMATWSERLHGAEPGLRLDVEVGGSRREATLGAIDPASSSALLRLAEPLEGVLPLALAHCEAAHASCIAYGVLGGYPQIAAGLVVDPRLRSVGGRPEAIKIHSNELPAPLADLEGAPVLVRGSVVGHLHRAPLAQTALATRAEAVSALLSRASAGAVAPGGLVTVEAPDSTGAAWVVPPLPDGRYHTVVCFRGEDRGWATALGNRLEGAGLRVRFEGFEVGDDPREVPSRLRRLGDALSAAIVVSDAWVAWDGSEPLDRALLDLQREADADGAGFRVVAAIRSGTRPPPTWMDRIGIAFGEQPAGRALERLEHALLGVVPPRPGTAAAAALRSETRPADELIHRVHSVEDPGSGDGESVDPAVQAAEAAGFVRVWEVWETWLATGATDTSVPLAVAESLLRLSHARRAVEVLGRAGDGTRARQLQALALSELDDGLDDAIEILERLRTEGHTDVETTSILAGRLKKRWATGGRVRSDLQASHALYLEQFRRTQDPYPGINAAATAMGLGQTELASALAGEVKDLLERGGGALDYWGTASLAEAHLILGHDARARELYASVVAKRPNAFRNLVTMRKQTRHLLEWRGADPAGMDDVFAIPKVVAFAGHLTDAADRPTPRFPEEAVPAVRARIRETLARLGVGVGYCSAARGADLIFIEELLARRGEVNVVLPFPADAFRETSVGPEWMDEFDEVLVRPGVQVTVILAADPVDEARRADAYAQCNRDIVRRARERSAQFDQPPLLVHVWDGRPGERGGTAELVRGWRKQGWAEAPVPPAEA